MADILLSSNFNYRLMNFILHKENAWWKNYGKSLNGTFLSNLLLKEESPAEIRIQKIRTYMLQQDIPKLSIHRARLFTESSKRNLSDVPVVRKAKAFAYVMEHIPIPLIEDQLLIGTPTAFYGGIEIDPEYYAGWLLNEVPETNITQLRYLSKREKMRIICDDDDLRELEDNILPFWKDRHVGAFIWGDLNTFYPEVAFYIRDAKVFMPNFGKGFSHTIQDYMSVVRKGLRGIKEEIQNEMEKVSRNLQSQKDISRLHHYKAMLICADAVINYARRCAAVCEKKAASADSDRSAELKEMARVCNRVPEYPAGSWWEALQSIQFMHMSTYLSDGGVSHSFGRMDYYLYPLYKKWVEGNHEQEIKAQELLECFFLKCYEYQSVRDEKSARGLAGDRTNVKITMGGVNEYGEDTTNILSYRFLEAHVHVHLKEPNLSVRIHKRTPEKFLLSTLEVIRLGGGLPQLINDEVIIPALISKVNVKLEDARHYADIGCQENCIDPNSQSGADANGHNNAGFFNLPKVLELTLNDGINPLTGVHVGPQTGNPASFETMESFTDAFWEQLLYAVKMNAIMNYIVEYHFSQTFPNPYLNLMHPGPRKSGIDYVSGGCKYNWIGAVGVGLATIADSIMVIEELIYNKCRCSWDDLLCALKNNWKGYEELRSQSLALPRYGAGGQRSEFWARWIVKSLCDAYEKHSILRGKENDRFTVGLFSMGIYLVLGEDVMATPDGRLAHEMISGSVAPSRYAEPIGYTASHNAASSFDTVRTVNGVVFNQIIPINVVSTQRDLAKWADLVRGYFDRGGMSVQYSILDKDELRSAQRYPEKHRDLIVRVGGYSAKFIDLTKEIQDEFIERLC
jgi:formate C-acetyltransferase